MVRFMYGDSLDAQSDIGGVDGAVQAALARTEVADGLASLSASAARKGPSQSQVASFFAERAHLWPSLSLVEPPLAQVQRYRAMLLSTLACAVKLIGWFRCRGTPRGNGDPNRQVYARWLRACIHNPPHSGWRSHAPCPSLAGISSSWLWKVLATI